MISWRHVTRWSRFVPIERAEEYCRLGWCVADAFDGTPHASYSVICAWLCDCKPVEPHLSYRHQFNEPLFELVAICQSCHEQLHDKE